MKRNVANKTFFFLLLKKNGASRSPWLILQKVCGLSFKKCPSQKWGYYPEEQTRPSIGPREVDDLILPGIKGVFRVSYSIWESEQIYSVVCNPGIQCLRLMHDQCVSQERVGKEKEVEDKGHRGKGKRGCFNLKFETLFPLYPREREKED